jgi:hypothetical protein
VVVVVVEKICLGSGAEKKSRIEMRLKMVPDQITEE